MRDLPILDPGRRVLGVIRPTVEYIGHLTQSRHIGVLGTSGTIKSESYVLEVRKLFPDIQVVGQACPMWVPLVEYNEAHSEGADYFVRKYIDALLKQDSRIDTVILGCTHYPILVNQIHQISPQLKIINMGKVLCEKLNLPKGKMQINFYFGKVDECLIKNIHRIIKIDYTIEEIKL